MNGILPVYGIIILQIANYRTGKLMPITYFMVDSKNEVIILHVASTQLQLVLCLNTAAQCSYCQETLYKQKTHTQ